MWVPYRYETAASRKVYEMFDHRHITMRRAVVSAFAGQQGRMRRLKPLRVGGAGLKGSGEGGGAARTNEVAARATRNHNNDSKNNDQPGGGDGEHYLFVYGTLKRGMHWHSKFLAASAGGAHFCGTATTVTPLRLTVGNCGVPYLLFSPPPPAALASSSSSTTTAAAAAAAATTTSSAHGAPGDATPTKSSSTPIGATTTPTQKMQRSGRARDVVDDDGGAVGGDGSHGIPVRGELYVVDDDTLTGLDQYEGVGKGYVQREQVNTRQSVWFLAVHNAIQSTCAHAAVLVCAPNVMCGTRKHRASTHSLTSLTHSGITAAFHYQCE